MGAVMRMVFRKSRMQFPYDYFKLEIAALEFQRFLALLKFESIELHATFLGD